MPIGTIGGGRRSRRRCARETARRLAGTPWLTNGEVPGRHLTKQLPLPADLHLLDAEPGRLSARGVDKVLRIPGRSPIFGVAIAPRTVI